VVVAFVGRFNRWKGQGLLLDAVSGLWREGFRDLRLLLVGGPPPGEDHLLSELQAAVGASDARDAVRILSFRPDVWPIWEACDIAVVPSLEPEPFGLVAIEAMLMGKPVVAAAHGGLLDIVESGQTGLLFEPGNVTSLKDALRRLIVDPALREKLGVAGRDRRLKLFSVESQVETVSKVYAELLGAP
ncbi:MAG: glycosyltransferase family 4 protein, partial [Burkholderiales bacterium]|nr:glycosyltransferase family 4 protein [Burkholderiales bacterium]